MTGKRCAILPPGLLLSLLFIASTPAFSACAKPPAAGVSNEQVPERALWVWNAESVENEGELNSFFDFVLAHNVSTVFLFVSSKRFEGMEERHRTFLRVAHAHGLKVDALNGEPDWLYAKHRDGPDTFVNQVIQFNLANTPDQRFDGIHLDVEPQALVDWKKGKRKDIVQEYLEFLKWCHGKVQRGGIPLKVDVPDQFQRIEVGPSSLANRVMDLADELVLMVYRDRAQKIIEMTQPLIKAGDERGKKVWVGLSPEIEGSVRRATDKLSKSEFEKIVQQVERAEVSHRSFVGVAIHDYRRLRELILDPDR